MSQGLFLIKMKKLNDLYDYNLKIYQDTDFFKFSLDSILLAEYVVVHPKDKVIDLCTGNAPIPMILSTRYSNKIFGIELQEQVFQNAIESVRYNNLNDQIELIHDNVKNAKNYFPGNNFDDKMTKLKEARLNNVFVKPSKEILKEQQKRWDLFIKKMGDSNILSLLVDSKIVVSSSEYAVIVTELEATSHLINTSIYKIEKEFNKMFKSEIKLISTTVEDWENIKKEYVKNTKNKVEYKMIEESKIGYNEEILKGIAEDVFKNVKIEME